MKLKEYISIYDDEVKPSNGETDHQLDCALINRQDEEDTDEEAKG